MDMELPWQQIYHSWVLIKRDMQSELSYIVNCERGWRHWTYCVRNTSLTETICLRLMIPWRRIQEFLKGGGGQVSAGYRLGEALSYRKLGGPFLKTGVCSPCGL